MYIKLTEQQLINLKAFLSRTELKGSEVMAYADVIQAISTEVEIPNKEGDLDE